MSYNSADNSNTERDIIPVGIEFLYTPGNPIGTAANILSSVMGQDEGGDASGSDMRVMGDAFQAVRRQYVPDSNLLMNPPAGGEPRVSNPTSFRGKTAVKGGSKAITFSAMPGRLNRSLEGTDFLRRAAADSARKTGLVYARSTALDKALLESGSVDIRKGVPTKPKKLIDVSTSGGTSLKRALGLSRGAARTMSPVGQLSEAVTNVRIDRALKRAADAGLKGEEALADVVKRVPKAADKVGLPTAKGLPGDKFGMDKGLLQRTTQTGELFENVDAGKLGKAAGGVAKALPVIGAVADIHELWSELNEEDVEFTEVLGATADVVLGLTGVGGILGDAIAFGFGHDGIGSLLAGDKD